MLEVAGISKEYQGFSLDDISLRINDGDYCVILGPSGAGKTLLLEILAGLITADKGKITIDGKDITRARIQARPFGLVFQDHAIFPHMTVSENIAYPLRSKHQTRVRIREEVERLADLCGIGHLLGRYPAKLSGGELQRTALARTLVSSPRYLLLDEPLASLDIPLKQDLRSLLKKISARGQTIIHVTHDFEEALTLAGKVMVISRGRIIQSGTASEVFHHPASAFMARFTGVKNYFPAVLMKQDDKLFAHTEKDHMIRVLAEHPPGTNGFVMVRGEDIIVAPTSVSTSATNQFRGIITEIRPAMRGYELCVNTGHEFFVNTTEESPGTLGLAVGREVWISFKASGTQFIPLD
jgi:ABC-type Fe3+/spermidine/putrescine transport system ATPase subunit